ncbi:permease prefix domain 1-containing protein [Herbidospora yilanensis]|uniref:permease prefix domain 1-containing protein n=1 Tax=Herbidospora yilanensis TaxID=354426 RepID=UPI0007C75A63|nr:permease prefix domain 1-containing protein [Herbidospora yilanensis]
MDTAFETAVVDDYVGALAKTLRGPRRARRDLLAEARDGLYDAAEAYAEEGLPPGEAQARAVADFGPVAEVAPGFQEELTAAQSRRTAALLFLSTPGVALMWGVLWQIFPAGFDVAKPAWFEVVARSVDLIQMATGLVGAAVLLRLRRTRRSRPLARLLGLLVWLQAPLMAALCGTLMVSAGLALSAFPGYLPGQVATWISLAFWTWQLWSAARCLRSAGQVPALSR